MGQRQAKEKRKSVQGLRKERINRDRDFETGGKPTGQRQRGREQSSRQQFRRVSLIQQKESSYYRRELRGRGQGSRREGSPVHGSGW